MSAAPSHSEHKADPERPPVGATTGREQVQQQVCRKPALLDHLVGAGKERNRGVEAERLCSLEIDHEFEFVRKLDWQVAGLFAIENSSNVRCGAPVEVADHNAIGC